MADANDNSARRAAAIDTGFFTVGSPLHAVRGGYVRRSADDALYSAVVAGRHVHIIAPAQCGKSSLIAATSERLRNNGFKVAKLDLAQITERDGGTDAGRWYYSIAYRLMRQLRLKIDLQDWWQDKAILSNRQRLVEFYIEVILHNIRESVVVFVDEFQRVENLPFSEHLLPSIRAAHNARSTEPEFQRLIFVLAGEGDPYSLFSDDALSPFKVSQAVVLDDFSRPDLDLFANELNLPSGGGGVALDRIYYWTSGQPYLTQKMARAVARERVGNDIEGHVDRIANQQLAGRAALHNEPHMSYLHRRVVNDRVDFEAMLNVYGRLRKGIRVLFDVESRAQRKLQSIGLVTVIDEQQLAVRNRLYEAVFTARWANRNLPLHWRGPALVTATVVLLMAIPFWYTQLLPKPYMRVLVSPTLPMAQVDDAWRNLRSFPGHVTTADRLLRNWLENRADQADDVATVNGLSALARQLPASDELPEQLIAEFWDRQARAARRHEDRDAALLASLQSLIVATPERRRRAAGLIGDDYPHLLATVPPQTSNAMSFDAGELLLSLANGAQVRQWSMVNDRLVAREPWTLSSLEVTPLVRRVVVDQVATVSRIGLTINISHARLDDVRLRLIAPSGRAVELLTDRSSASVKDDLRIAGEQLAALRGEAVNGTWTLSLRDEATGVSGHLHGWNLHLNSQVVVESFDRGLDIPAPVERESDDHWFADSGRYAVARALHSDNARMWDLRNARPARSIALAASERVVGLGAEARYLVTIAQDNVHLWNTASGRRDAELPVKAGGASVRLSDDGLHLLVMRSTVEGTQFNLWSLPERRQVASLDIAGTPARAEIDAGGQRLAVADYDRAVRIWDLRQGNQLSQFDLHALASDLRFSGNGSALAVVHGEQGISLWRVDRPTEPVLVERGTDRWQVRFSPSGNLLLAGSSRQGFQAFRVSDGAIAGPPLHAGLDPANDALLAFGANERVLLTAATNDRARFWEVANTSPPPAAGDPTGDSAGHRLWRESGDFVGAIAPGGTRLAIADRDGHVHSLNADASVAELAAARDEVSYMGHRGPVMAMTFSRDGELIGSFGDDGTVRVWDAHTGLPRPYHANIGASAARGLQFSPSRELLAVLGGQHVWLVRISDGAIVADAELGELHAAMAFGTDDQLFLGGESGTLRSLSRDRVGNWNLRAVWQSDVPLRALGAAASRALLVVVDANNSARLLDLRNGRIGASTLELPAAVSEVLFSSNDSRVLLRTARWIHRASVSAGGINWLDALRAPKPVAGSGMVFDQPETTAGGAATPLLDPLGNRVLLLTRDAGFAEVAEVSFEHADGPALFGTRDELLELWGRRLALSAPQPAAPQRDAAQVLPPTF